MSETTATRGRLTIRHFSSPRHEREEITIERGEEDLTAVYCGQLRWNKGFHLAVDAVASMLKKGLAVRLLVAGDYCYRNRLADDLRRRVAEEGLSGSIRFLGYVENVASLFALADVHVCPSLWQEPLANVVIEAKAAGVPSVVFPNGGLSETVQHGVDGWICRQQTAAGIEEALRYYLENPEERRRQGQAAQQSAQGEGRFGIERFTREWQVVFAGHGSAGVPGSEPAGASMVSLRGVLKNVGSAPTAHPSAQ